MNSAGGYLYLLYGDDAFSRDEQVLSLKGRMRAQPAGEHNLTELDGGEATVRNLRAAADAMPFLADRRMVVVRGLLGRLQGTGGKSGAAPRRGRRTKAGADSGNGVDEYQQLLDYLPDLPGTSSVAFVEDAKVDPAPIKATLPEARVFVREFSRPKPDGLGNWIRGRARQAQAELDEAAVADLARLGTDDLRRLDSEIRKLAAYANGRTITREDVQLLVVGRDTIIWRLLDALAARRRDAALLELRRLYQQGEDPSALFMRDIVPLYRRLLAAREVASLDRKARGELDVASLGLNPKSLPRTMEQASGFELPELYYAHELLLRFDRAVKTGAAEPEAGLELLVYDLCSRLSAVST